MYCYMHSAYQRFYLCHRRFRLTVSCLSLSGLSTSDEFPNQIVVRICSADPPRCCYVLEVPLWASVQYQCCIVSCMCIYRREASWIPDSSTMEPDRQLHDHPTVCAIAQQYSSTTPTNCAFIPGKKKSACVLTILWFFFYSLRTA